MGWLAAVVLAGGVAEVFAESRRPEVETVVRDVHVLPEGQAKVTGSVTAVTGADVSGPPIPLPVERASGTVTIHHGSETIAWNGGRPFVLAGTGGLDPGPAAVSITAAGIAWTLPGPAVLLPGRYEVRAPVAVGDDGLARPHDSYAFEAGDDTTIELDGDLVTPVATVRLRGPGSLVLEGSFEVRTREGRRSAARLTFGPGPFEVDLGADLTITATLQGPLAVD